MKPYTTDFDPPAPLIEVTVSNVLNRRLRRTFPALLDTGAIELHPMPTSAGKPHFL